MEYQQTLSYRFLMHDSILISDTNLFPKVGNPLEHKVYINIYAAFEKTV